MNSATRLKLFCAVSPGLEALLQQDLSAIAEAKHVRLVLGGCEVQVDPVGVWGVVLRSRLTESARVRIGAFSARTFDELTAGMAKLPWAAWLPRCSTPEVRVSCTKSKLWHSGAVQERVQAQVHARLSDAKQPNSFHPPAARVYVRIDHDAVRVSVDASGELLHRRGERTAVGRAPMRETLAAAVVLAAALPAGAHVWDPFCGSGTMLLEAGRMAGVGVRPREGGYAFELWPNHAPDAYAAWLAADAAVTDAAVTDAALTEAAAAMPTLYGCDHDAKELEGARLNLENAGLLAHTTLRACDFSEMAAEVPAGATIVSNLPYGRRADVGDVFRRFGRLLAKRKDLDVWLVLGHASHADALRIPPKAALNLRNGGLRVGLYHRPAARA